MTLAILFALPLLVACGGGSGGGLFSPDKGVDPLGFRFSTITATSSATLTNADLRSLIITKSGTAFAGSANGLFSFDPGAESVTFAKISDAGLTNQSINALLQESSGDLLIGTDNGLFRRLSGTGVVSVVSPQLVGKKVLCIAEQSSGTIWVGLEDLTASTTSIARTQNSGSTFTFWGSADLMTASSVVSLSVDSSDVFACGIGNIGKAGLFRFNATSNQFIQQQTPLASGATMLVRYGTTWYLSGPNSGVYLSTDNGFKWTSQITGATGYAFTYSKVGEQVYYWIATDKGLYMTLDLGAGWNTKFDRTNRLNLDNCRGVAVTTSGWLWIPNPAPSGGAARGIFSGD